MQGRDSKILSVERANIDANCRVVFVAPSNTILRTLKDALELNLGTKLTSAGFFADSVSYYTTNDLILIGPCLGSSAIYLSLTPILSSGVKLVIFVGTCGAISNRLKLNHCVLPSKVKNIQTKEECTLSYSGMDVSMLLAMGTSTNFGTTLATDNAYSTSRNDIASWRASNALAIEMEVFSIAKLQDEFGFKLIPVLLVSDIFADDFLHESAHSSKSLKRKLQDVCKQLIENYARG